MNCTRCKWDNPNDAYYCHMCGKKLKTKVNGWLICSIILLLLTGILGISLFNYSDRMHYLLGKNYDLQSQIQDMTNQIQEKDERISNLESEVAETEQLQKRINSLESQLPHNYYTKYDKQYIYNKCAGNYEKASCYFPEKGTIITIYTTIDGYGLTHIGGWIPMSCLEMY